MQYMLATLDLRPGTSVEDFVLALESFARRMQELDLIESVGPLTKRCEATILDTDERGQGFGFVTRFRDAEQSRRAIEYMASPRKSPDASHEALHVLICNSVFSLWEDVQGAAGPP